MTDPISGDGIPPISPNANIDPLPPEDRGSGQVGAQLYTEISSFYSWYQWIRKISDTDQGFQDLQIIMQIAQKEVLTPQEELQALEKLKILREDLDQVMITIDQIPSEVKYILDLLVENNSKGRVIHHATELQIKLIHESESEEITSKLDAVMDKVSGNYTDMEAEEMQRQLSSILRLEDPQEIKKALYSDIFPLLDKS